jgi:hypothetical protein
MSDAVESVLRKTPLFASLTDDETQALRRRVSSKHYDRGELLFSEGDACRGLFIVGKGKIRIFKLSPSGREQTLAMEGPGSSFAELPVFDGGNYPASAAASEDAEVLFISRKDFQGFLPRASGSWVKSDRGGWLPSAPPGGDHRGPVVHYGPAKTHRPDLKIGEHKYDSLEPGGTR